MITEMDRLQATNFSWERQVKEQIGRLEVTEQAWKRETAEKYRQVSSLRQELAAVKKEIYDVVTKKGADNCSKHLSKQKLLYCVDCEKAICIDCRHNHPFLLIEDVRTEAIENLKLATKRNQEMMDILNLEKAHVKLKESLREGREKWFAEMREKHESAIREEAAEVDAAFAQLREHRSRHEERLDAIEWEMDSPMMNRVAEQKSTVKDLVSEADVILEKIMGIPSIANLQNGRPSISIDTKLENSLQNPSATHTGDEKGGSSGADVDLSRRANNDPEEAGDRVLTNDSVGSCQEKVENVKEASAKCKEKENVEESEDSDESWASCVLM